MKVDCLMGTYGRHSLACEAVACFLQQTALSQASLLIYNQHPVPLSFHHPRVRVVNEVRPDSSLRFIRHRMHELSDSSANYIHWWDDDDLYLPWHLEDCLTHIGDSAAWKPARSWLSERNVEFSLHPNRFEGSWVFTSDYLRSAPLDTHPNYTDHPVILQVEQAGKLATSELGGRTSYIYRWDIGTEHVSGYGAGNEDKQRCGIGMWRQRSRDVAPDGKLIPADLTVRWRQYLAGTKAKISLSDWELNRDRLKPFLDI